MRDIVLAFFGSLAPSILFNINRKKLFWVGLSGAIGWAAYDRINNFTGQVILSTFIGALVVGIYSEVAARILKSPSTVFSVSGIFPLVPGIGAYNTAKFIGENNLNKAASSAIEVISSAGAIALGVMFISVAFRKKRSKNKSK